MLNRRCKNSRPLSRKRNACRPGTASLQTLAPQARERQKSHSEVPLAITMEDFVGLDLVITTGRARPPSSAGAPDLTVRPPDVTAIDCSGWLARPPPSSAGREAADSSVAGAGERWSATRDQSSIIHHPSSINNHHYQDHRHHHHHQSSIIYLQSSIIPTTHPSSSILISILLLVLLLVLVPIIIRSHLGSSHLVQASFLRGVRTCSAAAVANITRCHVIHPSHERCPGADRGTRRKKRRSRT